MKVLILGASDKEEAEWKRWLGRESAVHKTFRSLGLSDMNTKFPSEVLREVKPDLVIIPWNDDPRTTYARVAAYCRVVGEKRPVVWVFHKSPMPPTASAVDIFWPYHGLSEISVLAEVRKLLQQHKSTPARQETVTELAEAAMA